MNGASGDPITCPEDLFAIQIHTTWSYRAGATRLRPHAAGTTSSTEPRVPVLAGPDALLETGGCDDGRGTVVTACVAVTGSVAVTGCELPPQEVATRAVAQAEIARQVTRRRSAAGFPRMRDNVFTNRMYPPQTPTRHRQSQRLCDDAPIGVGTRERAAAPKGVRWVRR